MFRFLLIALFAVTSFGFLSSRIARNSLTTSLNAEPNAKSNGRCEDYKVDKNGRCPGDTGYVSFSKTPVKDFATFQAEQKAKKAAAEAAKKAGN